MDTLNERLLELMREQFDDDTLEVGDSTTAADVPGWDSLAHVNLIIAVEKAFGIRFAAAEIGRLKSPGQNVGTFKALIRAKIGPAA